jgi:5-deoxy-glucuronate isomerase
MSSPNWLIRNTSKNHGRTVVVTPENSDFRFLSMARIVLGAGDPPVTARNEGAETTLLVLGGSGRITVGEESFSVGKFDGVYVGRGQEFTVEADGTIDIVEGSAQTDVAAPTRHVRHDEIAQNADLHLNVGAAPAQREIYKVVAENVDGGKLLTGVTLSEPGNWTSWPPHEHAATQEELYLFFDMPAPGFATQYLYDELLDPAAAQIVYNDDAVVIARGYHPNVAPPGFRVNFAWLLCSLEDRTWRKVGGVNVQPEFAGETGLR